MQGIRFVCVVASCILWVSTTFGKVRIKRHIHTSYGKSCSWQPNLYFTPACINIFKHHEKQPGYHEFYGSDKLYNYAGANDLNKVVNTAAQQSFLSIKVNPLRYKGKALFGWFHLKLESTQSSFPLTWVFAQGETQYSEAAPAGSFVHLTADKWHPSCRDGQVEKETSRACYYAQDPFPLTAHAFGRYSASGSPLKLSLFFRLDAPLCDVLNSQNGIYFRTYVLNSATKGKHPGVPMQNLVHVEDKYYGGADPPPPFHASNVDCEGDIKTADWVKDVGAAYTVTDMIPYDTCMDNICPYPNSYESRCIINITYYGNYEYSWIVDPKFFYHCFTTKPARNDSDWPELETYIRTVENYTTICDNCTHSTIFLKEVGIPVTSEMGKYVWASRQCHSVFMVLAVIFLYPVSKFISAFYKETFMKKRVGANLHFWYFVHIYLSILLAVALVNGLITAIYGRKFYGFSVSLAGKAHVALGYLSILAALLGIVSSGIRFRTGFSRGISILAHFAAGELFYILSILSFISSMFVPGSPSGGEELPSGWEKEMVKLPDRKVPLPPMILFLVLWLCFDVGFYVISWLKFRHSDWRARRQIFPSRKWVGFVVPIPLKWSEDDKDFEGSAFRKFLLLLYVLGAAVVTIIFILWLSFAPSGNRVLGNMSYLQDNGKYRDIFSLIDDAT